jgi:alpha-glucosidase
VGRDPVRTPMQWNATEHAGFTTGHPWLPVAPDYAEVNVQAQAVEADSILSLHRRLLALRKDPALISGRYESLDCGDEPVLAYVRAGADSAFLVALNFEEREIELRLPGRVRTGTLVLSTFLDRDGEPVDSTVRLRGHEGAIIRLSAPPNLAPSAEGDDGDVP